MGGGDLVDREIVAPKDDHNLITSNCGHVQFTCQRGTNIAYPNKIVNLFTIKLRDYPGLFQRTYCNHKDHYHWKREAAEANHMVIYPWKNARNVVLLKMEEKDYFQGMWSASRVWKIQRNTF